MQSESIFGHDDFSKEFDPPIPQSDVFGLEGDIATRLPVDDGEQAVSSGTTYSSSRIVQLLSTKISENDGLVLQKNASQHIYDKVTLGRTTFDDDQEIVSKAYIDDRIKPIEVNPVKIGFNTPSTMNSQSLFIGQYAGADTSSTNRILAIGVDSGAGSGVGQGCTLLGRRSFKNGTGSQNTCIGEDCLFGATTSGSICLGVNAGGQDLGMTAISTDKKLLIGNNTDNTNTKPYLIEGTLETSDSTRELKLNADSIHIPSTLKSDTDFANLDVGQIFQEGSFLKMKTGSTNQSSSSLSSSNDEIITVSNGQMTFPNIHIGPGNGSNTVIGQMTSGGAWSNTTLYGVYAGYQANNLQDVTAVGWGASYYGADCKHSTSIGMHAGLYRRNEYNTQIGQKAGALYSTASGAASSGSHNTFVGAGAGENFGAGSSNLFMGAGVTASSGSNMLLIGRDTNHLIKGTFGSTANAEIELNADKIKLPSSIKTQADLASLDIGQIYVDTSDGNTLKMKM